MLIEEFDMGGGKVAYLSVATFEDDRERAMPYQVLAVVLKVPNQFHGDFRWAGFGFRDNFTCNSLWFSSYLRKTL